MKVFKYLNGFTCARRLFDYDIKDGTRINGSNHVVKHFNASVNQHFCPFKI